jgi:hypothetical protein
MTADFMQDMQDFIQFAATGNLNKVVSHPYYRRANTQALMTAAIDAAAINNHIEVVRNLYHCGAECSIDAINGAAENGHLEMVEWIHTFLNADCTTLAMDSAAANGHLGVVVWLHENRNEGCTQQAMNKALLNNHYDVVLWLLKNRTECKVDEAIQFVQKHAENYGNDNEFLWPVSVDNALHPRAACDSKEVYAQLIQCTADCFAYRAAVSDAEARLQQARQTLENAIVARQAVFEQFLSS